MPSGCGPWFLRNMGCPGALSELPESDCFPPELCTGILQLPLDASSCSSRPHRVCALPAESGRRRDKVSPC